MNNQSKNQAGAVLITALVILVLLTLLGLSAMTTTTLEVRMAANNQNINRAFQAAASGLTLAYLDSDAFNSQLTSSNDSSSNDLYNGTTDNVGLSSTNSTLAPYTYTGVAIYNSIFVQEAQPTRGSGGDIWDKSQFSFYHFDLSATGCVQADPTATDCINSISQETLHQGAYQVGNKAQ